MTDGPAPLPVGEGRRRRRERLREIRRQIEEGTYEVESSLVADAILEQLRREDRQR